MPDVVLAEAFPPGEFLREEIEARGWTQEALAEILGVSVKTVNEIITGKRSITPNTAAALSQALDTSAMLWMNLEATYRLWKAGASDASIKRKARLYSLAPIPEMVRRGWIQPSDNISVLEQRYLDFFGVKTLEEQPHFGAHAARKSASYAEATPPQIAWLKRAKQLAVAVQAAEYSESRLEACWAALRRLVMEPEEVRSVPRVLAEYGIRLVIVEPIAFNKMDGATFWINNDRSPVIAMSLRYDRIDYFWHTLGHECGHVKGKDGMCNASSAPAIDVNLVGEAATPRDAKPEHERRADVYAESHLVPPADLEDFIVRVRPLYSKLSIRGFAARVGVHPGIVVGQLQHREEIKHSHSREMLSKIRKVVTAAALTDGWGFNPKMAA